MLLEQTNKNQAQIFITVAISNFNYIHLPKVIQIISAKSVIPIDDFIKAFFKTRLVRTGVRLFSNIS